MTPAIQFQIAIRGKRVDRLSTDAARALVERALDREPLPRGLTVRIMAWRQGHELNWRLKNERAERLRETIRRALHDGRVRLSSIRRR